MSGRKAGFLFLMITLLSLTADVLYPALTGWFPFLWTVPVYMSVSMGVLLVPLLIVSLLTPAFGREMFPFRRLSVRTFLILVVLAVLLLPLASSISALTQTLLGYRMVPFRAKIPAADFLELLLCVGFIGPVTEELVFRGYIYQSMRKSGPVPACILSAFLFGLLHMNLIQASFAFVLGIVFAVCMVRTESLFAPMLLHIMFNSWQIASAYGPLPNWQNFFARRLRGLYGLQRLQMLLLFAVPIVLLSAVLVGLLLGRFRFLRFNREVRAWEAGEESQEDTDDPPAILGVSTVLGACVCLEACIFFEPAFQWYFWRILY